MINEPRVTLSLPARRARMLHMIVVREFVRVADLSEAFGISDVTVRADLDALVQAHPVRRVHGGVIAKPQATRRGSLHEEPLTAPEVEKERIGGRAAAIIASGMSVLLGAGNTTTAIARALAARTDLEQVTVITNGLKIALELENAMPRLTLIVTGGTVRQLKHSLVDPMASLLLERVHADLAFIGCSGVDVAHGVTNRSVHEAAVTRGMIASAERTVVVAASRKIGKAHLVRVADLADVGSVITGGSARPEELAELRRAGADVILVG